MRGRVELRERADVEWLAEALSPLVPIPYSRSARTRWGAPVRRLSDRSETFTARAPRLNPAAYCQPFPEHVSTARRDPSADMIKKTCSFRDQSSDPNVGAQLSRTARLQADV